MNQYDSIARAYLSVHDTACGNPNERRWYNDERCWNCDAPAYEPKRRWLASQFKRRDSIVLMRPKLQHGQG